MGGGPGVGCHLHRLHRHCDSPLQEVRTEPAGGRTEREGREGGGDGIYIERGRFGVHRKG